MIAGLDVIDTNGTSLFEYKDEKAVAVIDMMMPEMDGYEATQKIRKMADHKKDIPIIAMTANAMKGDREKCLDAGMNDYVSKPVKPQNFLETITAWIQ